MQDEEFDKKKKLYKKCGKYSKRYLKYLLNYIDYYCWNYI